MPTRKRRERARPRRVLVYLVRGGDLLVFHRSTRGGPRDRLEVPKGGVGKDETPRRAAKRECLEESGLKPGKLERLGDFAVVPPNRKRPECWRAYWGEAPEGTPERFDHAVGGKGKDRGRTFHYRFEPLASVELTDGQGEALPLLRALLAERRAGPLMTGSTLARR